MGTVHTARIRRKGPGPQVAGNHAPVLFWDLFQAGLADDSKGNKGRNVLPQLRLGKTGYNSGGGNKIPDDD